MSEFLPGAFKSTAAPSSSLALPPCLITHEFSAAGPPNSSHMKTHLQMTFVWSLRTPARGFSLKLTKRPPPPPPPRKYNKKAKKWKLRKKPLGHLMGLTISCHPVLLSPGPMPRGAAASARPCILLRAPVWGHPPVQRPFFWISKIALVYFYLFF